MPEMEVAMDDRARLRSAELCGALDDLASCGRRAPDSEALQLGKPLPRLGDAKGHVRPSHGVDRELRVQLQRVEGSKELAQRAAETSACVVVGVDLGELASRQEGSAVERPGELIRCLAQQRRVRNGHRKERPDSRQVPHLVLDPRDDDLAARKAEDPLLVDEPDRVVPAGSEELERALLHLRELLADQPSGEWLVDDDLRSPLGHYGPVSAPLTAGPSISSTSVNQSS